MTQGRVARVRARWQRAMLATLEFMALGLATDVGFGASQSMGDRVVLGTAAVFLATVAAVMYRRRRGT
jgi:hypothetical protein